MDYSSMSKKELLERRRELKFQAEKQFNRFNKLKGKDKILQKYQPYQIFKEMSKKSKSGQRALQFSRSDTRNKVLEDVVALENILSKETSTVTGARRVLKKQVSTMAKRVKIENAKRAKMEGIEAPKESQADIEKILTSENYFKFLHSREFKELSKINKKASEEAIDFYVRNAKWGIDKVIKHFKNFLESDDEMSIQEVFPTDVKESQYL